MFVLIVKFGNSKCSQSYMQIMRNRDTSGPKAQHTLEIKKNGTSNKCDKLLLVFFGAFLYYMQITVSLI